MPIKFKPYPFTMVALSAMLLLFVLVSLFSCKTPDKSVNNNQPDKEKKLSQAEQLQLTALFIDANREKALENEDKALGLFAQCIKRNPQYAPAMYEMARILVDRREYSDALVLAINAVKFEPTNSWYQLLLAEIYVDSRDYNEAAKVMKQMTDQSPNNTDYSFMLANIYIMSNKYTEAIKVYDNIEKSLGVAEETALQKEKLYLQMGKVNKATEELENLINKFPTEIKYMGMLAELYLATGNEMKGLDLYQRMQQINPNDPYIHLSLADYYKSKKNDQKSFEELQLAFSSPDMDIDAKIKILLQYFQLSESKPEFKEQAYTLNKIVVETHPDDAKGWSMYGDFLYRDNRNKEASDAFRKVIHLDSSKYVVWEQLLLLDSELNDDTSMLTDSYRAMDLFPDQAEPYLYNGFANTRLKNLSNAIKSLKAGISFATGNEMIVKFQTSIGDALYKMKDYDGAFEAYEKALKLDPENVYILNNYSYYLALQNRNLNRAEELAQKLNNIEKNKALYEDTYAWVFFKQENFTEAKSWAEKALEHGGSSNSAILEHYGDILYKLNEKEKALEYWLKARDAGGNSEILIKKINDKTWYE
jgi:tetratricopeptide (TPR) repeat protein